eukprot:GGOE01020852.1.p1 GENE.GGOE01020852.1~~GGOE01020852.1.p1  ORF type:complete len:891 (-),score=210.97 GGOE01020852.1:363-2786(-)
MDRAVVDRVNVRMNEYIAEKFPDMELTPGSDLNISSMVRLAKQLWVAAEWDVCPDPYGDPVEVDVLGLCLNEEGVSTKHQDMVYWGNASSSASALTYQNGGIGDDKLTFKVEFYAAKVARCQEVAFFVHIRDSHRRRQSLANLRFLRLRIYHKYNDRFRVLARMELNPPFQEDATSMEALRLKCQADGWHVVHVGRQCIATRHAIFNGCRGCLERPLVPPTPATAALKFDPSQPLCWGVWWVPDSLPKGGSVQLDVVVAFLDQQHLTCHKWVLPSDPTSLGAQHRGLARWSTLEDEDGDREVVEVTLAILPPTVWEVVVFGIISTEHQLQGFTFANVCDVSIRLFPKEEEGVDERQLYRAECSPNPHLTCVELGRIARLPKDASWGVATSSGKGFVCDKKTLASLLKDGRWLMRQPATELVVGQEFAISTACPGDAAVRLCIGWLSLPQEPEVDVAISVLLLDEDGHLACPGDLLCRPPCEDRFGAVALQRVSAASPAAATQSRKGAHSAAAMDRQVVIAHLSTLRPHIRCLRIIAHLTNAVHRPATFAALKMAYIRLCDVASGTELGRHNVNLGDLASATAVELCHLSRSGVAWTFQAADDPLEGSIAQLVRPLRPLCLRPGNSHPLPAALAVACFAAGCDRPVDPSAASPVRLFVFGLGVDGRCCPDCCAHFRRRTSEDGALTLAEDGLPVSAHSVEETAEINLQIISPAVQAVCFVLATWPPGPTLGEVGVAHLRHFDRNVPLREKFRCEMDGQHLVGCSAVELARLRRGARGRWAFHPSGEPSSRTLQELCVTLDCPTAELFD